MKGEFDFAIGLTLSSNSKKFCRGFFKSVS